MSFTFKDVEEKRDILSMCAVGGSLKLRRQGL